LPRGVHNSQSSEKNAMMASRSCALNAARNSFRIAVVAVPFIARPSWLMSGDDESVCVFRPNRTGPRSYDGDNSRKYGFRPVNSCDFRVSEVETKALPTD